MRKLILTLLGLIFFASSAQAYSCTALTKNLNYGSTNSTSGGQVTLLQQYLHDRGFLAPAPTGRYGQQTVAAVKKFQAEQGITTNGVVGPQTRAGIQKISCLVLPVPAPISVSQPEAPTPAKPDLVTQPRAGVRLIIGQETPIRWSPPNDNSTLSILLERESGAGAGHVGGNVSGSSGRYDWKVGEVFIPGSDGARIVTPGNYRIRIVDTATYGSKFDQHGGVFTIKETPLRISDVLPETIMVGDNPTVIRGSGFTDLTKISLDGDYYHVSIFPFYKSQDHKTILFNAPQYLSPGQYTLSVFNDYTDFDDNLATGTPSNLRTVQIISS